MTITEIADLATFGLLAIGRKDRIRVTANQIEIGQRLSILSVPVTARAAAKLRAFAEWEMVWWTQVHRREQTYELYVGINPYEAVKTAIMWLVDRELDRALEEWSLEYTEEE